MTRSIPRLLSYATVGAGVTAAGYVGLVTGACPLDLGIGRRLRPLGPQLVDMAAPREVVFDVIAQPYQGRAPRALADKLRTRADLHRTVCVLDDQLGSADGCPTAVQVDRVDPGRFGARDPGGGREGPDGLAVAYSGTAVGSSVRANASE
jgi:hypothetical protein